MHERLSSRLDLRDFHLDLPRTATATLPARCTMTFVWLSPPHPLPNGAPLATIRIDMPVTGPNQESPGRLAHATLRQLRDAIDKTLATPPAAPATD